MSWSRLLLPALIVAAIVPAASNVRAAADETIGIASWYGARHDGCRTSSGETFHMEAMTAASKSLPLGSHVRVTLNETGQSVVVKINDRMGARTAIIDLSKGAAREIGLLGRGRGVVSITATDEEPVEVAEASEDETADVPDTAGHGVRRGGSAARVMLVHHTGVHLMRRHRL